MFLGLCWLQGNWLSVPPSSPNLRPEVTFICYLWSTGQLDTGPEKEPEKTGNKSPPISNPMRATGPILTQQAAIPGLRAVGFQQSPVSNGSLVVPASWPLQGYRGVEKGPSRNESQALRAIQVDLTTRHKQGCRAWGHEA